MQIIYSVAHSQDLNRLYGVMLDGVFTTEERAREWVRDCIAAGDPNLDIVIQKHNINDPTGKEIVFKGKASDA